LTPPDPQLKGAWYPGGFKPFPLNIDPGFKTRLSNATCAATQWVPDDHTQLFRGNTDDHFRLGIKVTKASVRLYVDFFGSDILVASPLGKDPQ
jgi:hypothetical protein